MFGRWLDIRLVLSKYISKVDFEKDVGLMGGLGMEIVGRPYVKELENLCFNFNKEDYG
jgi:hypothetical protein